MRKVRFLAGVWGIVSGLGGGAPVAWAQATCFDAWNCASGCEDDACVDACVSDLTGDEAMYAEDLRACITELCGTATSDAEAVACACQGCGYELEQCFGADPCTGDGGMPGPATDGGDDGAMPTGDAAAANACGAYVQCAAACAEDDQACYDACAQEIPDGAQAVYDWWTTCGEACANTADTEEAFLACLCQQCPEPSAACFGLQCASGGGGAARASGSSGTTDQPPASGSDGNGGAATQPAGGSSGGGAQESGHGATGESCAKFKALGGLFKNVKVCGTPAAGGGDGGGGGCAAAATSQVPAWFTLLVAAWAIALTRRKRRFHAG